MSLEVNIEKKLDGFTLRAAFSAGNIPTALLGASGCGKSMTLRCIAGIVKPDKGRIVLAGRVLFDSEQHIDLPPQQRGAGLLFQNYALFPNMTVEQNILCGPKAEKDRAVRQARCAELLRAMRLEPLAKRYPAQLSGGQQQRTALARILAGRPRILMLDEPSARWTVTCARLWKAKWAVCWPGLTAPRFWSPTTGTKPTAFARKWWYWTAVGCCAPATPGTSLRTRAASRQPGSPAARTFCPAPGWTRTRCV